MFLTNQANSEPGDRPFGGSIAKSQPLARAVSANLMHHAKLYTRQGCHLCDEALAVLLRHGLSPSLVDIDADPALRERFNECVPVVEIDGKERFRGRVNEVLLARILAAGR
jgi:glutaredoxin